MKRALLLTILGLMLAGFQSAQRPNFSGVWQLDMKKSTNLPESFKSVESYTTDVRQTKDSMVIMARLVGNGQDVKFPVTAYLLNGSEVFREDTLRLSKRWSKLTWPKTGKKLIVHSRVEQARRTPAEKYTQNDVWELTDRNTLQMSVTQKSPDGKELHSERRIFHRVK
jgi:hypothetical protein